jgi:hypothetical protein
LVSCQKENEGLRATLLQMHSRRTHDINWKQQEPDAT